VTHSIRDLLDVAFTLAGIEDWSRHVVQDPQLTRKAEANLLVGDATRARERLGWTPTVAFSQLIAMMLEHDINEQRHSGR